MAELFGRFEVHREQADFDLAFREITDFKGRFEDDPTRTQAEANSWTEANIAAMNATEAGFLTTEVVHGRSVAKRIGGLVARLTGLNASVNTSRQVVNKALND